MHFEFGFLGKQNILAIVVHIAITPPLSLSLSLSLSLYIYIYMKKLHLTNPKRFGLVGGLRFKTY
jgi:hypothetical protein